MKFYDINQYVLLAEELYYWHSEIEFIGDIYGFISWYNPSWTNESKKKAWILVLRYFLSNGTHEIRFQNKIYSAEHQNWEEFFEIYNKQLDELIELKINKAEFGNKDVYNRLIELNLLFFWTSKWFNEKGKLNKVGILPSTFSKFKFDPYYQYRPSKNEFISVYGYSFEPIRHFFFILFYLYYRRNKLSTVGDIKTYISFFNPKFSSAQVKQATLYLIDFILSDGSHQFSINNSKNSLTYSKKNANIKEGLQHISEIWDEMLEKEHLVNTNSHNSKGEIINVNPFLHYTKDWNTIICFFRKALYNFVSDEQCISSSYSQSTIFSHYFIPNPNLKFEK